jgi:hypothetical protein
VSFNRRPSHEAQAQSIDWVYCERSWERCTWPQGDWRCRVLWAQGRAGGRQGATGLASAHVAEDPAAAGRHYGERLSGYTACFICGAILPPSGSPPPPARSPRPRTAAGPRRAPARERAAAAATLARGSLLLPHGVPAATTTQILACAPNSAHGTMRTLQLRPPLRASSTGTYQLLR